MSTWNYQPPSGPLVVVHLDRDLLALNKPAGLLSVPGRGPGEGDCALSRVQAEHPTAREVHRLDGDTSGLLLFALRKKALTALMEHFRERRVHKEYLALVEGDPGEAGTIDLPLSLIPGQPRSRVDPQGRPALTTWRRLTRRGERSLLALYPHTGRSHQLRVHLAALGTPIVGDRWYGRPELGADRLYLHAVRLQLPHPYRGDPLHLFAPPPEPLVEGTTALFSPPG